MQYCINARQTMLTHMNAAEQGRSENRGINDHQLCATIERACNASNGNLELKAVENMCLPGQAFEQGFIHWSDPAQ